MISTTKEFEIFEKLIEGFSFGRLQDIITLKGTLEKHDYTLDDVESYVQWKKDTVEEEQRKQMEEFERGIKPSKEALKKKVPECPECGALLEVIPIRIEEGHQNVHGYKSVWRCFNEDCVYEKYGKELALDIVKELIGAEHAKILGYGE